jgi:hypothetical protein
VPGKPCKHAFPKHAAPQSASQRRLAAPPPAAAHLVVKTELRSYMVHLSLELHLQLYDLLQYWLKLPKSVIL